ncbi:MAG: FecR family protein [Bacteroidota bacterium]
MKNENEHYLADWLAGKLSDDQLQQLVSEDDFLAFQKIKNVLHNTTISEPNMEANLAAIKHKLATRKIAKSRKVIPMWSYAIAACLLVSFGLYQLYFLSNEVQTNFGSTKTIVLNDNSKVTLNAKSKVCYANLFQFNRSIKLEGEAFFEVEKGRSFTVTTPLGEVKVLGTKFNVVSFSDYFEVVCYEGKVRVEVDKKATILTKGESVRCYNTTFENWADTNLPKPLWMTGETELKKVPMKYVFAQFENQFDMEVVYPKNIESIKFTGSFTNANIETALQSICIPLHLKYSTTASGKIQISE